MPTVDLPTNGGLTVAPPSADGDLAPIVSPLVAVTRLGFSDEPGAEDHVYTPADLVVGPAARFEANVAAVVALKALGAESRPATSEERTILARFSGFGDSTFEPAFRLSALRTEDHAWVERGQRLRSLLDDAEWQSVERSRLNAFFTSPDVITAIWDGLLALGLESLPAPRILEPAAGVGRFLGLQPTDIAARSARTAIELDTLTARMLKALYPRVAVHSIGFQDAPLRDNSFDVAVSNVPFGDFPVVDRAYLKAGQRFLSRTIHNYFFVKALAKLRPGGVLAFITSRYTLDAPTAEPIRAHLHQQADLVAAVRLPAGTFPDTDVVTDLVILRKRMAGEGPWDDTWLKTISQTYVFQRPQPANARHAPGPEEVRSDLNAYFVAHPEMVLGIHGASSGMYGAGYTVALPDGGREETIATLVERMRALPSGLLTPAPPSIAATPGLRVPLTDDVGHLQDSARPFVEPQLSSSQTLRVPALLAVRDAARAALRAQLDGAAPQEIEESQRRLNAVYDQFVFRYGPLNAHANVAAMGSNPDAFFLRALERWDATTQLHHKTGRPVTDALARERLKMPLFHEIVVRQARPALSARSLRDAYLITLNERGGLDFGRMAELLGPGSSQDDVRDALAGRRAHFRRPRSRLANRGRLPVWQRQTQARDGPKGCGRGAALPAQRRGAATRHPR